MPLDSICITALSRELNAAAAGMRVDKIQQPERDEILLSLRGSGSSVRLLCSAGTGDARVHFTDFSFENPQQPPMFCMLLRKHITGARIKAVTQPGLERAIDIAMDTTDQLGELCERHLIVELMGRYSNMILTGDSGMIIDCLRRVDATMSEKRQVLPGLLYRLPPPQNKLSPLDVNAETLNALMAGAAADTAADKWLLDTFAGMSPLVCRELVFRACGDTDARFSGLRAVGGCERLTDALCALAQTAEKIAFEPYMLVNADGEPADFSYMPITQYGMAMIPESFETFSELLEAFYTRRSKAQRMKQRASSLMRSAKNSRDRVARRLISQRTELEATKGRERLREFGDIITANIHKMEKGMTILRAEDFYSESGEMCEIRLDALKSPQQNAAKYYRDYTKARNAEKYLTEQIASGEAELEYLNSVLDEIERAESELDLSEIRRELTGAGYIKGEKSAQRAKPRPTQPMYFTSTTGTEIRVGRNNTQNDILTFKSSHKADIWLHVQKIHGSHVIITAPDGAVDDTTLEEAACLAAWYSQARSSAKAPVDYTQVRYVKKPSGAKPGMVIYTDYKTVYAKPDSALAERLQRKK